MSTTTEIAAIQEEVSILADRIEAVEARLGQNGAARPMPFDLAAVMPEVRQITQEIFPGKCEFTSACDPVYPDDQYLLVRVEATGTPKEIVDRSCRWDERIRQIPADLFGYLRLFIIPR